MPHHLQRHATHGQLRQGQPRHRHQGTRYKKRQCIVCRCYLSINPTLNNTSSNTSTTVLKVQRTKAGQYTITPLIQTGGVTTTITPAKPIGGRSAYVCFNSQCLGAAIKQRKFARALKSRLPDGIVDDLQSLYDGLMQQP